MMSISDMVLLISQGEIKTVDDAKALIKTHYKRKADKAIKYAEGKMKAERTQDVARFLAFVDTALNGFSGDDDFSRDDY